VGSRLVWVLASAGLLVAALPPHTLGPLGWVALVPLVLATRRASPWKGAIYGAAFGAASIAGMHYWLWHLSAFKLADGVAIGIYLSLYPAAWCAALAWMRARRLPWVTLGALAWALLHVLRGRAGFLAGPWDPLAYTQTQNSIVLQVASLGGEPLVSLIVCIGNLALAHAWETREVRPLFWPGAAILAAHAYGAVRLRDKPSGDGMAVAVIQPGDSGGSTEVKLDTLRTLTLEAATDHPDLVVWPESAVSGYFFDPAVKAAVSAVALEANVPILFGSADFGKYGQEKPTTAEDLQLKNQAFLVGRDGTPEGIYTKIRLVPFAEWTPLSSEIAWPRWLLARQLHGIAGVAPGIFRVDDGESVGVLICWENLFTDLSGDLDRGGASVILQLTNDSDFAGPAEPSQHNAASILRAVEYGHPVVIASTTGPSIVIDSRGRVRSSLGQSGSPGRMIAYVNTARRFTVYAWLGLKWMWLAVIVAAVARGVEMRAGRAEP